MSTRPLVLALLIAASLISTASFFDPLGLAGPECGNDTKEGEEVCDGKDLAGLSCASLGFEGGTLGCEADCKSFKTVGCEESCDKDCDGRECGADPVCGKSCGTCEQGSCVEGRCVNADCPADKDCSGRDCGPDPICGISCGTCEQGVCISGQCDAEASCPEAKDCTGRVCGPDPVCGLSCGSCDEGSCVSGQCSGGGCQHGPFQLSGAFKLDLGDIQFDSVSVEAHHKQDVDAWEDQCINDLVLTFTKGSGCRLQLRAGSMLVDGSFPLTGFSFSADSQCPNFPDDMEGSYEFDGQVGEIASNLLLVPDRNSASSCFPATLTVRLQGWMNGSYLGPPWVYVKASTLTVSGGVLSTSSTSGSCPTTCASACGGATCGDDGCGYSCGACAMDASCESGACAVSGACSVPQCGPDGAGGSYGRCVDGQACSLEGCCVAASDCGAITYVGCCEGNAMVWCDNAVIKWDACITTCGWKDATSGYLCDYSGADPSGVNPITCDWGG